MQLNLTVMQRTIGANASGSTAPDSEPGGVKASSLQGASRGYACTKISSEDVDRMVNGNMHQLFEANSVGVEFKLPDLCDDPAVAAMFDPTLHSNAADDGGTSGPPDVVPITRKFPCNIFVEYPIIKRRVYRISPKEEKVEEEAAPWTLPTSRLFSGRRTEMDSRDWYDTHKLLDQAFQADIVQTKVRRSVLPATIPGHICLPLLATACTCAPSHQFPNLPLDGVFVLYDGGALCVVFH